MPSNKTPTFQKRLRFGIPALYFFLPIVVFGLTSLPWVGTLTPFLALVLVAALLTLRFTTRVAAGVRVLLWTLLVLALVGSTGWFFSPFFFALYLLAIGIGFLYTPVAAVAFTLALITMFAFSVGEVSPTHDFLVLLSLLSVIPITVALRKSFLLVQQEQKDILILEGEDTPSGVTSLEAILRNRVNQISIVLRQPLTYIKQGLALLEEGKLTEKEYPEVLQRMRRGTEELFTVVKEFEQGATRNILVSRGEREKTSEKEPAPRVTP